MFKVNTVDGNELYFYDKTSLVHYVHAWENHNYVESYGEINRPLYIYPDTVYRVFYTVRGNGYSYVASETLINEDVAESINRHLNDGDMLCVKML